MNKNILFVSDKVCDGNPELGWSNNFHNIFATFRQSCPDWRFDTIHLDEADYTYNTHIDNILPNYCRKNNVKTIIFSLIAGSPLNPSVECYKELKTMGIYLCCFYPDTGWGWPIDTINTLDDIVDLHVSWDNPKSSVHSSFPNNPKHLFLWPPQDSTLYYFTPFGQKDIDVSFIGSYDGYRDRIQLINLLKENFPNIFISGGQRREKLSPEQYASYIRRSKIVINFALSQAGVFWQSKSRIFETTACGSLLMEMANPSTKDFFTPSEDYVEYQTPEDLIGKIDFYLKNPLESNKIALNGHSKYKNKWNAKAYWDIIIDNIEKGHGIV